MNDRIAIFDFCETLVPYQSADAFVNYVIDGKKSLRICLVRLARRFVSIPFAHELFAKLFPVPTIEKRLLVYLLKGEKYTDLCERAEAFYKQKIVPSLIPEIKTILLSRLQSDWKVFIVSGGIDLYLNHLSDDFDIAPHNIISTHLEFDSKGICRGKILGLDCMGKNKLLNVEIMKDKQNYIEVYSDSRSDLPLLMWADEAFVVRESSKKSWVKQYNYDFKEIIWKQQN